MGFILPYFVITVSTISENINYILKISENKISYLPAKCSKAYTKNIPKKFTADILNVGKPDKVIK